MDSMTRVIAAHQLIPEGQWPTHAVVIIHRRQDRLDVPKVNVARLLKRRKVKRTKSW